MDAAVAPTTRSVYQSPADLVPFPTSFSWLAIVDGVLMLLALGTLTRVVRA